MGKSRCAFSHTPLDSKIWQQTFQGQMLSVDRGCSHLQRQSLTEQRSRGTHYCVQSRCESFANFSVENLPLKKSHRFWVDCFVLRQRSSGTHAERLWPPQWHLCMYMHIPSPPLLTSKRYIQYIVSICLCGQKMRAAVHTFTSRATSGLTLCWCRPDQAVVQTVVSRKYSNLYTQSMASCLQALWTHWWAAKINHLRQRCSAGLMRSVKGFLRAGAGKRSLL